MDPPPYQSEFLYMDVHVPPAPPYPNILSSHFLYSPSHCIETLPSLRSFVALETDQ